MAKLIGTAGHIDHGKTSLIRALTGIDADRLPEEKARGMTIDIGFAYLDMPGHGRVSIVDVPGHERFIRNMLVGALGIDVALLCVAADESVMPQTREHFQILQLLPVQRMVVALTRSDLVDAETLEFARAEVAELLAGTRFQGSPIVPVSAVTGAGLDQLRKELSEALSGSEAPARPLGQEPWYLPVDRVFSVKGHGCVVTGTVARGTVKVGDTAFLEPGQRKARIRGIHCHGEQVESSEKGRRTALNLSGVKVEEVARGMALGAPGSLFETRVLDARMNWLTAPTHHERVRVSIGSAEAIARVYLAREEDSVVQLRMEEAVACALDQPLIVRRYSPPILMGGGVVAVPVARPRRRAESAKVIDREDGEPEAVLRAMGDTEEGVPSEEICRVLGKTPQALGNTFERLKTDGLAVGFAGIWFRSDSFQRAAAKFLAALAKLHEENPEQAYVPREKIVAEAKLKWSGKPLDRIIAGLAADARLEASGTGVKLPGFQVRLKARQRELLDRVLREVEKHPVNTPGVSELAEALAVPPQAIEEIVRLGQAAGELAAVGPGVFYTSGQLQRLKEEVRRVAGGKPFRASAVRDALGTTRKYAIPLLEYLDSIRFTTRVGDLRAVNEPRQEESKKAGRLV